MMFNVEPLISSKFITEDLVRFNDKIFFINLIPISNFNEFCSETGLILSWGMKRRRFMFEGSFYFIREERRGKGDLLQTDINLN